MTLTQEGGGLRSRWAEWHRYRAVPAQVPARALQDVVGR